MSSFFEKDSVTLTGFSGLNAEVFQDGKKLGDIQAITWSNKDPIIGRFVTIVIDEGWIGSADIHISVQKESSSIEEKRVLINARLTSNETRLSEATIYDFTAERLIKI